MKGRNSIADNSNVTFGLIILIIGTVWLLKALGVMIPDWVTTWPMFLIAIGIVILIKYNFQSTGGAFILLLGSYFLLRREGLLPFEVQQYLLPVALIIIGIVIMFRKQRRSYIWEDWSGLDNWSSKTKTVADDQETFSKSWWNQGSGAKSSSTNVFGDGSDFINLEAFLCSISKRVLSKNFQGGKAFALFGGLEIDLSQADLGNSPVLDVEIIFGGLKIIMPPHWDVQLAVSNIFAGVEDKRIYPQNPMDATKVLKIKGTLIFGGIELKSY